MVKELRMTVRLPSDAVDFLDQEAKRHFTSRNAQIVHSIREWMKAATREEIGVNTLAAAENSTALQGGETINQAVGEPR